ncbi:uncharacterized protein LOC133173501 [Saccostrea echinata]|uniref:uncharacterized protein LOC133173501 n=1 Tax=Saccostrea echinata TaxID=191078 RepID=UPI002A8082C8|nr:uncharacterized protein LOC133173501 [Saccostrea echinata]
MSSSDEEADASGLFCIHCNEDEVKWKCDDCSREFCDKCKRIHLIADEETQNHHLFRYGSSRSSGPRLPDVIRHPARSVNEIRRPRIRFQPTVKSRIADFKPRSDFVENSTIQHIRVVPRGNGEAWLKCGAISEEVVLHDKDGSFVDKVHVGGVIQDFVVTRKREIIFTKMNSNTVWLYSKRAEIKPLHQLYFFPNCLCLTPENDLLICAASTQQCQGRPVMKLSRSSEKSVIPVDQRVKLGDIYSLAQSANGTICLVEKGGWGPGRVIGLSKDGQQIFEYRGSSGSLNPSGISCDPFGFIYISDCGCHNVHVISQSGEFRAFLLPMDSIKLPEAIDVGEDGVLWVGNGHGEIKVYELKSDSSQ